MQETWVQSLGWEEDPWVGRRERLPTSVFWPGEFQGLYSSWSHKELDMTEQLSLSISNSQKLIEWIGRKVRYNRSEQRYEPIQHY